MTPQVSVLIPAYNEERTIAAVIRKVHETGVDKEILVVNDGSTDATGAILASLRQELPIRVVTHPKNLGKGAAIRSGIRESRGEIVLIQDADLECDPTHLPVLVEPIVKGGASVVYGSRFLRARPRSGFLHRLAIRVITGLINVLYRASLTDAETGYKVFRREVAQALSLRAASFEFEVEFTCKVIARGYAIVEVPVAYTVRRTYAEGKKIAWMDGVYALWVILCCRFNPRY